MGSWKDRLVWHRVRVVPGDDKKVPYLALIQQRLFGFLPIYIFRNFAINPQRKAMQNAVDAWFQLEEAMREVEEYKRDNEQAVDFTYHNRKRDGVSRRYKSKRLPREELIPVPPEFKEVESRYKRAISQQGGRERPRLSIDAEGPLTRYVPPGFAGVLPNVSLEGKQSSDHEWFTKSSRQQQQQGSKRNRSNKGGGGNQQQSRKQQGDGEEITITLPHQRHEGD